MDQGVALASSERADSPTSTAPRAYSPPLILPSREHPSWDHAFEDFGPASASATSSAAWPAHSVSAECPRCRCRVVTRVSREAGLGTWAAASGLALAGCVLGCCLLPFAWDCCKDTAHTCPECGCQLGKRACAVVGRWRPLHHNHHLHHNHPHLDLGHLVAATADGGSGGAAAAAGWAGLHATGLISLMRRHV